MGRNIELADYLKGVFCEASRVQVLPAGATKEVPLFLRTVYRFARVPLLGRTFLLAMEPDGVLTATPTEYAKHAEVLRTATGIPVAMVLQPVPKPVLQCMLERPGRLVARAHGLPSMRSISFGKTWTSVGPRRPRRDTSRTAAPSVPSLPIKTTRSQGIATVTVQLWPLPWPCTSGPMGGRALRPAPGGFHAPNGPTREVP